MIRNEGYLLSGIFLTSAGTATHLLVLGKYLFDLTGSAKAFGGAVAFEQLVSIFAAFLAGPLVDRAISSKFFLVSESIRGIIVTLCSVVLFKSSNLMAVYIMIFAIQIGKPFYKSGLFVVETEIFSKEQLPKYNGRSVTSMQLGSFLGIWIGGLLIIQDIPVVGFTLNGISFLSSGICLALATRKSSLNRPSEPMTSFVSDWKVMIRMIQGQKSIVSASLLGSIDYALPNLFNILLAPLVFFKLSNDSLWLSLLDSSFALGAAIGGLILGRFVNQFGLRKAALWGFTLQALSFLLLFLDKPKFVFPMAIFFFGFGNSLSWSGWQGWLQTNISKPHRAKFSIFRQMITTSITAIFALLIGYLLEISFTMALILVIGKLTIGILFSELFFKKVKTK